MKRALAKSMYFPHRVDGEISLTLLTALEVESFYALVDQNREHLGRWFRFVDRYESIADAASFATENLQRLAEGSGMGCLVWYREHLAGWVELLNIDRSRRRAEIGFWLGQEFQHRGIARRAAMAMLEHAFTFLDFAIIHASTRVDNHRSRALLENLGFASESQGDRIVYELTREQWLGAK